MERVADVQSPFDSALQIHDLRDAAEEYALRHGHPGTPEYRAAWIRFRQHIRTADDLRRWRLAQARRSASQARAKRAGAIAAP